MVIQINIVLSADVTITSTSANQNLTISGNIDNGGFLLTGFGGSTGSGMLTISGVISGSGGFTKIGGYDMTLSADNSYWNNYDYRWPSPRTETL